jgi:hypothetical protein
MKHFLLLATALAVLGGVGSAEANQTGGTSSASSSTSRAVASTMSAARSAAVGNVGNSTTVNVSGTGSSGNSSTGTSDPSSYQYIGYGGGYTLRNTPEVIPPNVVGGNPCAIGASAGLSMAGFGIAGGATWADKQCERRQQAALLFNIGKAKAATELLCQDDNIRAALRVSGEPCVADAPPVAAAVAAPVARMGATVPPAAPVKLIRPEWCYTAGPAELRHHSECQIGS